MQEPATGVLRAEYAGRARDLFPLYLGTLALTLVTVGVYRFWARTRVRKHVWSRIVFLGDALEYTGTGTELFVGFLKAMLILVPLTAAFSLLSFAKEIAPDWEVAFIVAQILLYVLFYFLFYAGILAAIRYRHSRTRWRAIRFVQTGSPWRYAAVALAGTGLMVLSLGLTKPFIDIWLADYETNNRRFGSQPFSFAGSAWDLLGSYAIAWVLLLPTVGLSWFWYDAARTRYIAAHTRFGDLVFDMTDKVTGWRMARLKIGNIFIAVLSLGVLYPIVMRRNLRFWCDNLEARGTVDFAAIAQGAPLEGSGEGIAGFFGSEMLGG